MFYLTNNFSRTDNLFKDFLNWAPTVRDDISEDNKNYTVYADLPGYKKENIKLKVEKEILTIEATRGKIGDTRYNSYKKSYILPDTVNPKNIEAKFEDGVLELKIPKDVKKLESHTIQIK